MGAHPESLLAHLQMIPDPRRQQGRRYPLPALLGVLLLGVLHGHDSLRGAWVWAEQQWPSLWRTLGVKGKAGILQSMPSRAAFLSDSTHRIQMVYVPKHTSWLNQVEIWLSILGRRGIKRGNCTSVDDLKQKMLGFIAYFNRTLAKLFQWTYRGRTLVM